jgi:hypothetical protein
MILPLDQRAKLRGLGHDGQVGAHMSLCLATPTGQQQELVCLPDLTCELRSWPHGSWARLGVGPQAAAGAVIAAWRRGDLNGLQLGGLTGAEAMALGRPAMIYLREQLCGRLARQVGRVYQRWLHPPADAGLTSGSCRCGHRRLRQLSATGHSRPEGIAKWPQFRMQSGHRQRVRTPNAAAAVRTVGPDRATDSRPPQSWQQPP